MAVAGVTLATYRSHKTVHAGQIVGISFEHNRLLVKDHQGQHKTINVTAEWLARHKPVLDGYFVVYNDGYCSFSPQAAFADGYTHQPSTVPHTTVVGVANTYPAAPPEPAKIYPKPPEPILCSDALRLTGQAAPRTCKVCGLGPCKANGIASIGR